MTQRWTVSAVRVHSFPRPIFIKGIFVVSFQRPTDLGKAYHEGPQLIYHAVSTSGQGAGGPLWPENCHQPISVQAQARVCWTLPQAFCSCQVMKCLVLSPQGRTSPHRTLKTWWKWWRSCRKVLVSFATEVQAEVWVQAEVYSFLATTVHNLGKLTHLLSYF